MRFGARMMLLACCAGPAVAAMLVTGSGPANAAPLTPGVSGAASFGHPGPGRWGGPGPGGYGSGGHGQPNCDRRQLERWDVNGTNTVNVVYSGGTATYGVSFRQNGECLTGTLTDPNIPAPPAQQTGPIAGTVNGNTITFSFTYTYPNAPQGTRTFTGTINRFGAVSGGWNEAGGTEHLSGTWSLASRVDRACSWRVLRWQPRRECHVHS